MSQTNNIEGPFFLTMICSHIFDGIPQLQRVWTVLYSFQGKLDIFCFAAVITYTTYMTDKDQVGETLKYSFNGILYYPKLTLWCVFVQISDCSRSKHTQTISVYPEVWTQSSESLLNPSLQI